jgi:PKD repeat protein
VAFYTFSIALPASSLGYILASQVNFRINGITNLSSGGNLGATYSAEIPGTTVANGPQNTSANFIGSDLVVVCANNNFSYSFAAQDADGDALRYSFCTAYNSNTSSGGGASPTGTPPFQPLPYGSPFTEFAPLGPLVQINSATGLITGIAPDVGIYVVTVCVEEVRNGIVIAMQRKDLQINIADCDIAAASLLPEYMLCRNSQTITIGNLSNSPLIVSTDWEFLNTANTIIYSSSGSTATYTFPTIGLYTVKLVINRNQACTDSTTALIRVFPGFIPDFISTGICFNKPTVFIDNTTSVLGIPNTWKWDFGESSTATDNSLLQNPTYTYPSMGLKTVQLIATDSRGCRDTVYKNISIIDKPPIGLLFRDTVICKNDNLVLQASGAGNYSWTPPVNIINANTSTPTVSPVTTTLYYVNLDNNGCLNSDSIMIRVVNGVSLQAMADTTICRGDTIQLRTVSDGLQYAWTPATQFINPLVQNPLAISNNVSTNYRVVASIGGCSATGNIVSACKCRRRFFYLL